SALVIADAEQGSVAHELPAAVHRHVHLHLLVIACSLRMRTIRREKHNHRAQRQPDLASTITHEALRWGEAYTHTFPRAPFQARGRQSVDAVFRCAEEWRDGRGKAKSAAASPARADAPMRPEGWATSPVRVQPPA